MLTITTNSFENDVLHADKPVLVDFWAQWCPYCRRIAPAFDKVGEQYADTLIAGKINYIRDLLGHSDISTTEIYARADEKMKRKALMEAYSSPASDELPTWKKDKDLLDWLKSL